MNFWDLAINEAKQAALEMEIPVGALIVYKGQVLVADHNRVIQRQDPSAHAEMNVIRKATEILGTRYLTECDLYTTLEPCAMCAQCISWAQISRLYFGAYDIKSGAVENGVKIFHNRNCHHVPEIYGGFREEECTHLLSGFFASLRNT